MTAIVVGVWVATLAWLLTGFLVFTFAIARPLRDKGAPGPSGFRPPAFIGSHTRELASYRVQRLRTGRSLAWWWFMIAWRFLFALLAIASLLITLTAALEVF